MWCALLGLCVRKARELHLACLGMLDPCYGSDVIPFMPVHSMVGFRMRSSRFRFPVLHTCCKGILLAKTTLFRPTLRFILRLKVNLKASIVFQPVYYTWGELDLDDVLEFSDAEY